MCNPCVTILPVRNLFALILLVLLTWASAGCVLVPEPSRQEAAVAPKAVEPAAPEMEVPDGYVESIPPLPKKGYLLKELARDVYFFSNGVYNNMFIVTTEGIILTDPIRGAGPLLKQAMAEVTTFPIKIIIYTHPHLDHIGDAPCLPTVRRSSRTRKLKSCCSATRIRRARYRVSRLVRGRPLSWAVYGSK